MHKLDYKKGLYDLGNGLFAYLQPDGSWGLSNAGLIVDGEESILIDTLMDLHLTQEMLNAMTATVKAASSIDKLIITHANPDHINGNQLVQCGEIISSRACAQEMNAMPSQSIAESIRNIPGNEELKAYVAQCLEQFDFNGINIVTPTKTFEKRLDIKMPNKEIRLLEVGPAHTRGDIIIYIPENRVVFTGDILFVGGTPLVWAGPVSNWIKACNLMLDMDAEIFVPGHGPISDKRGVAAVKGYLEYIQDEAKRYYDEGLSVDEAVESIVLGEYSSWSDKERIAVNIHTLYKEFRGDNSPNDLIDLFAMMAKLGLKSSNIDSRNDFTKGVN